MQINTPKFVHQVLTKFLESNFEIYIVGGVVRDLLMDKSVTDWDFTTNATPEQILELFPEGFYDNRFGTVGLVDPEDKKLEEEGPSTHKASDGHNKLSKIPVYEITTFRKEIGYADRRHPDKVEWGKTLEEDLQRRDFTINSMVLKQESRIKNQESKKINFELIDLYNGQQDLEQGLIRAVGNPQERFQEDALRMIRAVRIAAQLGFLVEKNTLKAIQQSAALINQIAAERIRDELFKLLATNYTADGIRLLASTGLLEYTIPELLETQGVDQAGHHTTDVWEHSLKSLQHCPSPDPLVRLGTLIHDIGKPASRAFNCQKCSQQFKQMEAELVCPHCQYQNNYYQSVTFYNHEVIGAHIAHHLAQRLRLSTKQRIKLVKLVRWHMFTVDERQTDKAIRRFIRNVGKEYLHDILALRTGDRLGGGARESSWRLEKFKKLLVEVQKQPFTVHDLNISGHEIMIALNLKPGPKVGEMLKLLYDDIVDKKLVNKREVLQAKLKQLAN